MKWDYARRIGSKEWGKFRAKVLGDFEKEKLFVVIKGIGGEELKISGDYETILRKLAELYEVIDSVVEEVEDIVRIKDPEAHKRVLETLERRLSSQRSQPPTTPTKPKK